MDVQQIPQFFFHLREGRSHSWPFYLLWETKILTFIPTEQCEQCLKMIFQGISACLWGIQTSWVFFFVVSGVFVLFFVFFCVCEEGREGSTTCTHSLSSSAKKQNLNIDMCFHNHTSKSQVCLSMSKEGDLNKANK